MDQLLLEAVVDFAAEVADVDVDDVGEAVVIHIPDMFDDHGAAEGTALVAHHVFENAEFLGREVDGFGAAGDFAADAIEREVGDLEALGRGLSAAQEGADAGEEFDEGEGLDEVIVGALFEAFDAIVESAAGAENQHRRADLAIANFLEHLEAVHIGKHAVQNHQVVVGGVNQIERGAAGQSGIDGVSGAFQPAAQKIGDAFFVLDHENSHLLTAYRNDRAERVKRGSRARRAAKADYFARFRNVGGKSGPPRC